MFSDEIYKDFYNNAYCSSNIKQYKVIQNDVIDAFQKRLEKRYKRWMSNIKPYVNLYSVHKP